MKNPLTKRMSIVGGAILSEAEQKIHDEARQQIVNTVVILKERLTRRKEQIKTLESEVLVLTTLFKAFEGGHFQITPTGRVIFPDSDLLQRTFDGLQ